LGNVEGQAVLVMAYKDDAAQVKHFLKPVDLWISCSPNVPERRRTVADDLTQQLQEKDRLAAELEAESKKIAPEKTTCAFIMIS
jgi:hypothetical protein